MDTTSTAIAITNVQALNLDFLVADLRRQGHTDEKAVQAVEMYRQFLETCAAYPTARLVPTKLVDLAWHAHMIRPQRYYEDTMVCFRRILDHVPGVYGTTDYNEAWEITRKLVPYGDRMPTNPGDGGPLGGADCFLGADCFVGADCFFAPKAASKPTAVA